MATKIPKPMIKKVPPKPSVDHFRRMFIKDEINPPIIRAWANKDQYRNGYLFMGKKGRYQSKGLDHTISVLNLTTVSQPKRANGITQVISPRINQSVFDF